MPAGITPFQENILLQSAQQGRRDGLGVLSTVKCIHLKSDTLHLRCGMKYRSIFRISVWCIRCYAKSHTWDHRY